MSELGQSLGRAETAFGDGEPFVLLGSGDPIKINTIQDLIEKEIPHSRNLVVRSFGTVGWDHYVQGMAERGQIFFVRMANPTAAEFALEEGVPQALGQA